MAVESLSTSERKTVLEIDPDVHAVLEFMQSTIRADRLISIADSIPIIAKGLWGHFAKEQIQPIALIPPKVACPSQSNAIG